MKTALLLTLLLLTSCGRKKTFVNTEILTEIEENEQRILSLETLTYQVTQLEINISDLEYEQGIALYALRDSLNASVSSLNDSSRQDIDSLLEQLTVLKNELESRPTIIR